MLGLIAKPYKMSLLTTDQAWSTDFPAASLLSNNFSLMAQSPALAANGKTTVSFDLGQDQAVDVLALLWHNLASNDKVQVQAASNNTFSNLVYDSGQLSPIVGQTSRETLGWWKWVLTLPAPVTARYWRISVTTATARTFTASRFFVGKKALFAYGPAKAQVSGKDLNASVTTEVGETTSQEDDTLIRPVVSLSFNYEKQSEMEQVLGAYTLSLGTSRPMLICTDLTTPYLQDNTAFGRLEQVINHQSDSYDIWQFDCVVTSVGP